MGFLSTCPSKYWNLGEDPPKIDIHTYTLIKHLVYMYILLFPFLLHMYLHHLMPIKN